jgi:N-acyl-D-aspartate/D-glutamate deacylase
MVNRNDRAVSATIVNGHIVYQDGKFADGFGTTLHAGTFLRRPARHRVKHGTVLSNSRFPEDLR